MRNGKKTGRRFTNMRAAPIVVSCRKLTASATGTCSELRCKPARLRRGVEALRPGGQTAASSTSAMRGLRVPLDQRVVADVRGCLTDREATRRGLTRHAVQVCAESGRRGIRVGTIDQFVPSHCSAETCRPGPSCRPCSRRYCSGRRFRPARLGHLDSEWKRSSSWFRPSVRPGSMSWRRPREVEYHPTASQLFTAVHATPLNVAMVHPLGFGLRPPTSSSHSNVGRACGQRLRTRSHNSSSYSGRRRCGGRRFRPGVCSVRPTTLFVPMQHEGVGCRDARVGADRVASRCTRARDDRH